MESLNEVLLTPLAVVTGPILWTWMRPAEQFVLLRWLQRFWPVLRPILGGLFLLLGVAGIILPILQGVLFLVLGAALIGPRNRFIRWMRVQYRLLLRTLHHASWRPVRWLGFQGRMSLRKMRQKSRELQDRFRQRRYIQRRFRVVMVPTAAVTQQLNYWRKQHDPAWRYGLPPHIVLVASSCSDRRVEFEYQVRVLCQSLQPFDVSLYPPVASPHDWRIICPVDQGISALQQLQSQLKTIIDQVDPSISLSKREIWPGITVAKLKPVDQLVATSAALAAQTNEFAWTASALELYEERFGHMWYRVRTLPFNSLSHSHR